MLPLHTLPLLPPAGYPRVVTHAWPICLPCGGAGQENEAWDPAGGAEHTYQRIDGSTATVQAGAERLIQDPTAPPPYKGRCRTCYGAGRVPPPGWVDPVWDEHGRILEPGSVPELQRIVRARQALGPRGGIIP